MEARTIRIDAESEILSGKNASEGKRFYSIPSIDRSSCESSTIIKIKTSVVMPKELVEECV